MQLFNTYWCDKCDKEYPRIQLTYVKLQGILCDRCRARQILEDLKCQN